MTHCGLLWAVMVSAWLISVDADKALSYVALQSRLLEIRPGYYMVFRVQAGIKESSFQRYTAQGQSDDANVFLHSQPCGGSLSLPCGCKVLDGIGCSRHYRSTLLDILDELPIERIRVGVYKNGMEQKYFEFGGDNKNSSNFFTQANLLNSSYTDLKNARPLYFSISGHAYYLRRFFIHNNFGGCPKDQGWLTVMDGVVNGCGFDKLKTTGVYPEIKYAKGCTMANLNSDDIGFADALIFSMKFNASGSC